LQYHGRGNSISDFYRDVARGVYVVDVEGGGGGEGAA